MTTNLSCGGAIAEIEPRENSRIWEAEIVCGMILNSAMMGGYSLGSEGMYMYLCMESSMLTPRLGEVSVGYGNKQ